MNKPQRVFLHLSDIHFKKSSDLDPDLELQQAIWNDAEATAEKLGGVDGVLVSGDIAFSGQEEEYDVAKGWLKTLCGRTGADTASVRIIPGNHDVNRGALKDNPLLVTARDALRDAEKITDIDSRLLGFLENQPAQDLLMQPTSAYNRFAATLGCAMLPGKLWWEEKLKLNDGSELRLRGLHSALLCDERDTEKVARHKMILGSAQVNLNHIDGVAHLVMCHHPFDWLRDASNAEQALNAYASIQLFGHKHTFDLNTINGKTLRLGAGAMQPERDQQNWEPRYNFLGISVSEDNGSRILKVEVWPRLWNSNLRRFQADFNGLGTGQECRTLDLSLPEWRKRPNLSPSKNEPAIEVADTNIKTSQVVADPTSANDNATPVVSNEPPITQLIDIDAPNGEALMNAKRKLVYAYLNLPYPTIIAIAVRLNLIRDEDEGVSESELFNRFLERAEQENLLSQLWDEVGRSGSLPSNPFSTPGSQDATGS